MVTDQMSQSASKRQRTSVDTFVPREGSENIAAVRSVPTTPTRRASYLSPTKASLARSHPKLLLKSPGRATKDSRLRHDPEGRENKSRNADQSRHHASSSAIPQQATVSQAAESGSQQRTNIQNGPSFADAIVQAFKDVPANGDVNASSSIDQQQTSSRRMPLSPRQPRVNPGRLQESGEEGEGTIDILPKLVKQRETFSQPPARSTEDEIDLPPTPVQLGLTQAPYRPRGLASSSSGGSRSGSGKNRRRTRNSGGRANTSSPLKPRNREPVDSATSGKVMDDEQAEEASESEGDEPVAQIQTNVSIEAVQRQAELSDMQATLEKLRQDLGRLEALSEQLKIDEPIDIGGDLRSILTGSTRIVEVSQDSLEAHPTFVKDPRAFLDLFAPANLNLSHTTAARTVRRRPKVIHKLRIAAPEPWPKSTMQFACNVTIDSESASIESVTQIDTEDFRGNHVLQRWIAKRLSDPLHQYDVAGLTIGAGQYFDARVKRASIFHELSTKHAANKLGLMTPPPPPSLHEKTTPQRVLDLSPYMETSQLRLATTVQSAEYSKDPSKKPGKRVLLTYDLDLTWTGTVRTSIDITCSDVGPRAHRDTKELFQDFMNMEGVVIAFEKIWKLITNMEGSDGGFAKNNNQQKRPRKKVVL